MGMGGATVPTITLRACVRERQTSDSFAFVSMCVMRVYCRTLDVSDNLLIGTLPDALSTLDALTYGCPSQHSCTCLCIVSPLHPVAQNSMSASSLSPFPLPPDALFGACGIQVPGFDEQSAEGGSACRIHAPYRPCVSFPHADCWSMLGRCWVDAGSIMGTRMPLRLIMFRFLFKVCHCADVIVVWAERFWPTVTAWLPSFPLPGTQTRTRLGIVWTTAP